MVNPSLSYILGNEASLPEGLGAMELDVVFTMGTNPGKNNNNTWVSFYVLPKE